MDWKQSNGNDEGRCAGETPCDEWFHCALTTTMPGTGEGWGIDSTQQDQGTGLHGDGRTHERWRCAAMNVTRNVTDQAQNHGTKRRRTGGLYMRGLDLSWRGVAFLITAQGAVAVAVPSPSRTRALHCPIFRACMTVLGSRPHCGARPPVPYLVYM